MSTLPIFFMKLTEREKTMRKFSLIHIILSALGALMVYSYVFADTIIFLICVVSVSALWWFSVSDCLTREISAPLVYAAIGILFLLRFYALCSMAIHTVPWFLLKTILVFLAFRFLSNHFKGRIGNGDFDVAFILYLCVDIIGLLYAFFAACILVFIRSLPIILKNHKNLKSYSVPLIPYLYAGYITVLLFEKGLIFI